MYLAKVYVSLKLTVNDPQGLTISGGLHSLGFYEVKQVRAGKYIEVTLDVENLEAARERVSEMCRQLLANPVIEQFRFKVEEVSG
ncbi:MAG: phosphoribosylformylglycinamidine synthase subunit PurS [Dehalococcoidia bacterium]|jgi:phosphoribosylformylglycinamidine synthase|nr:phosphoribosylformylglycinamidine synthase subunit PurS [Dehalococcoidia bacterium]